MNTEPLQKVGSITSTNGAEITAFDAVSNRLFVVAGSIIEIQKLSNKGALSADGSLLTGFTSPAGTEAIPNSVAVKNGIVAVAYAIQDTTTKAQLPGRVSFYNAASGAFLNAVAVGALPDMLTFTPDGTKVLVANEGEPNSYGQANSVDPEGSVSIINIAGGVAAATVQTADFTSFNSQAAALKASGVRIISPGATVAQDLEPEYIAVAPDGLTAWVTLQENNAVAILDIATGKITSIVPLGAKNYNLPGNGIDASDRDLTATTGKINIQNQPAFGLYQPDAIASFSIAGKAYYITANEGDARNYPGFNEEVRVGATSYVLDPVKFPTAATLKQDANLGRLTVTTATGDTDGDGDIDRIESFGARSFSIWDATGKQIYDSGDRLEQITATLSPTSFNSDGTAASFDNRSDNKGPEPEGVVVGVINNRTYAFIGLERTGDVIVYDVTNPSQPQFVQYLNPPEDIGVEGLTFIAAADSPTGKPLLVTAAEVSRTVGVFEISLDDRSTFSASLVGQQILATGLVPTGAAGKINGVDVPLGGLSGVAYDPTSKIYYAISDDRSQFGPARFYNFTLDPNTLATTGVNFTGVTALKDAAGNPFALNSLDPEGIALSGNGTIFVSSEGEVNPAAGRVTNPFIKEFSIATGQEVRSLIVPTKFLPKVQDTNGNGIVDAGDTQTAGVRNNAAFESLTISPDRRTLYTATENSLFQDGTIATTTTGTNSRIVQYNLATGLAEKEYIYQTDRVAVTPTPATAFATNGLVDLLAIDNRGTMLALERSFSTGAPGTGTTIKIYEISLPGASDISSIDSLASLTPVQLAALQPVQKRLLLNLDALELPTGLDNIEGLAFGAKLADGRQSIVLVSDNNFSPTQFTQILTLSTDLVPEAATVEPVFNVTSYEFTNLPKLGTTSKGQDIFLGGFSGLYFQGIAANGNLKFITNTDRGPNGDPTGAKRPFFLPNFQPEIVSFELNRTSGEINITKRTSLFRADGKTPLTGLPNLQAAANGLAYTDEIGVDLDGNVLANDPLGADLEGIVIGPDGNYWLVDEYRPAIYQFDVNGKLLDRFIPKGTATAPAIDFPAGTFGTEVLPEVYAQRRSNRGFEAVAIEGTKLYAFMQSPIDNPDNAGDTVSRASRTVRILEFDTTTKAVTGEYLYLLDDITGTGNAKTDKLGDAVSLGGGKFAVVERDDLATSASNKLIYQIDLAAATNINNPANFSLPAGKTIEQLTPAELTAAKIAPVSKSLIANAAKLGYTGVEKLEGLALVAPNTLGLINDNDFNVAPGSKVPEKLGLLELAKDLPVTGIISTKIITATDPADLLLGVKEANTRIIGDRRNNTIDVSIAEGNNQIYAGDGADELYAGKNDRLFGEGGNDILDATDGKGGNFLDGGSGDDRLFAGTNDTLFGGDGDDTLFAGLGGNTIAGGNGRDIFFLALASLPTKPNIITDFKAGTDTLKIVGISGIGDDLTKLTATIQGSDTLLKAGTVDLALLKGIQANSIADVLNPNPNPNPNPVPPILPAPTPPIGGISLNKNLFITDTTIKGFGVNAVSQKAGSKVNEIGFFAVDDMTGKVGGIAPGAAGYLRLAIDSAKPIFSTLDGSFFSTTKREVGLDPNKTYQFFQIQDGSIADIQQQIISGKIPTNILFALPDTSGNSPFKVTTNSTNDGYQMSVNNNEPILNVSKLAGTTPNIPIGAKSQGLLQGRILDLTDYAGKTLKADISTTSNAGYNNNIAFYVVEDAVLGTIKTTAGTILNPNNPNYAAEAIKSAILQTGKTDNKLNQDLTGGKIYAPVVIAQGTLADFASKNPTNGGDANQIHAYFNYIGANPDKLDHFRLLGNNTFGVEDLYGGGDRDFNDVIVNVNIKLV